MAPLRTAAKLTQSIYGISRIDAIREMLENLIITIMIAINSTIITISPINGDLKPKKAKDQRVFISN